MGNAGVSHAESHATKEKRASAVNANPLILLL